MIIMVREWKDYNGENAYYILYESGRTYYRFGENRLPAPARKFIREHIPARLYNPYFGRWENNYRA